MRNRIRLLVVLAAATFLAAPNATLATAAQDMPPAGVTAAPSPSPKPGSQWTLRYSTGFEGTAILSEVKDGKFFFANGERVWTTEWNMAEGPGSRTGSWVVYSPHTRSFSFPLWEGKKWEGRVDWTSGSYRGSFSVEGEAKKWETITVPAGSFETLRVENKADGKPWSTCWYAPEAEFPIKCTFTQLQGRDYELVHYKLVK